MLLILMPLLAQADPSRLLARSDEVAVERTWWSVDGLSEGPARPRWRNRRGTWRCWTWPDGVAVRCQEWSGKAIQADHRFDAGGAPLTTLLYEDGSPSKVVVHGAPPVEVSLTADAPLTLGDVVLHGPGAAQQDRNGGSSWTLPEGTLAAQRLPATQDVRSDAFRDALRASCACVLEDRSSSWLDGQPAVRYRVRHVDPDSPTVSELWLLPRQADVLLLSFTTPAGDTLDAIQARLAHGRAWISLTTLSEEAP